MKSALLLAILMAITACGPRKETVKIYQGKDGKDGANGHSLVSEIVEASECIDGGNRLDIFLDMDDSLSVSEGDQYQSSLVACNGAQGEQGLVGEKGEQGEQGAQGIPGEMGPQGLQGEVGPQGLQGIAGAIGPQGPQGIPGPVGPMGSQGPQGPAGASYSLTISVVPTGSCAAISGSSYYVKHNGSNAAVYSSSSCSSHSKLEELSDGESFWLAARILGVFGNESFRVINFGA